MVANSKKLVAIMTHTHTHTEKTLPTLRLISLPNAMKNKPAKFARATYMYKEDTRMGHTGIQHERLPKSKMASSDDRFTFEIMHVLRFGNGLNEELCCRFIFKNLQQSL